MKVLLARLRQHDPMKVFLHNYFREHDPMKNAKFAKQQKVCSKNEANASLPDEDDEKRITWDVGGDFRGCAL